MQRAIAGVLMGSVMMFMVAFLTSPIVYMGLGPDEAFEPSSFRPTQVWIASNIVIGFVAAAVGGYACASISQSPKPPFTLAILAALLGLSSIVVSLKQPDLGQRTAEVSNLNAILSARHPLWVLLLNPVVGVVGVLYGSQLWRPEAPVTPPGRKFA